MKKLISFLVVPVILFSASLAGAADGEKGKKDICTSVKESIRRGSDAKVVVRTAIELGHSACVVVQCALVAGGDPPRVLAGAIEAGARPEVVARCATDAGMDAQQVAEILTDPNLVVSICYFQPEGPERGKPAGARTLPREPFPQNTGQRDRQVISPFTFPQ